MQGRKLAPAELPAQMVVELDELLLDRSGIAEDLPILPARPGHRQQLQCLFGTAIVG